MLPLRGPWCSLSSWCSARNRPQESPDPGSGCCRAGQLPSLGQVRAWGLAVRPCRILASSCVSMAWEYWTLRLALGWVSDKEGSGYRF